MNCEDSGLAPISVVAEGVVKLDAVVGFAVWVVDGVVVRVDVEIVDLLVELAVVGVIAHCVVGVAVGVILVFAVTIVCVFVDEH